VNVNRLPEQPPAEKVTRRKVLAEAARLAGVALLASTPALADASAPRSADDFKREVTATIRELAEGYRRKLGIRGPASVADVRRFKEHLAPHVAIRPAHPDANMPSWKGGRVWLTGVETLRDLVGLLFLAKAFGPLLTDSRVLSPEKMRRFAEGIGHIFADAFLGAAPETAATFARYSVLAEPPARGDCLVRRSQTLLRPFVVDLAGGRKILVGPAATTDRELRAMIVDLPNWTAPRTEVTL
jgi:hypothetical protein